MERATLEFVDEVSGLLWPRVPGGATRALLPLPAPGRPRMVVPAGPPRVAAAAVRALAADRSARGRMRREGVATALRLGAGRVLTARGRSRTVGAGGIDEHLSAAVGRPVVTGMLVGAPRANRKPVLVLLDPSGEVVGYAKVGCTPVTRALVTREADALERVGGRDLTGVEVPRLLHRGPWAGLELVVQSPLDTARAGSPGPELLERALATIAASAGGAGAAPLRDLPAWRRTVTRLDEHDDAAAARLLRFARRLEDRSAGVLLDSGAWHGDLTPWNVGVVGDRVLVWDWERYEDGVPVGFDALHHELAVLTQVQGLGHADAARHLVRPGGPAGRVPGRTAEASTVVVLAYLITVGTRYLVDGQAAAGHRSGRLDEWLTPVLVESLGDGVTTG